MDAIDYDLNSYLDDLDREDRLENDIMRYIDDNELAKDGNFISDQLSYHFDEFNKLLVDAADNNVANLELGNRLSAMVRRVIWDYAKQEVQK